MYIVYGPFVKKMYTVYGPFVEHVHCVWSSCEKMYTVCGTFVGAGTVGAPRETHLAGRARGGPIMYPKRGIIDNPLLRSLLGE